MALPKSKGAGITITALGLGSKLPFGKPKSKPMNPMKAMKDEPEEEESEGEEDSSYGQELAGEELLTALQDKDAKGVYDAIKAIVELCGGSDEE